MATHTPFFDLFPKIQYDINRSQYPTYESATNVFFRMAILKNVLNNTSSYYVYDIDGDDTPEIVAEKVYGDSGAGWIIIYANQIVDPQFDWVLDDKAFNRYIDGKYGSVAIAQTTFHHYEKVIERTVDSETSTTILRIDREKISDYTSGAPYDYYNDYLTPFTIDSNLFTVDSAIITADVTVFNENIVPVTDIEINKTFDTFEVNGKTVQQVTYAQAITNYDYESQLNDSRRQIKVIKKDYYTRIMEEFRSMVGNVPSYIRTVS